MGRKVRHAKLNVGETIAAAYDEKIEPRISRWQHRELTKGYWGFINPEGETYCVHLKDEEAATAHIRAVEMARHLQPSNTKAAAGSR